MFFPAGTMCTDVCVAEKASSSVAMTASTFPSGEATLCISFGGVGLQLTIKVRQNANNIFLQ
jgi:hypothetical protein